MTGQSLPDDRAQGQEAEEAEAPRMPANGFEWAQHVCRAVEALAQAEELYGRAYVQCLETSNAAARAMYPEAYSEEGRRLALEQASYWLGRFHEWTANLGQGAERMAEQLAEEWGKAHKAEDGGRLLASILPRIEAQGPVQ